MPRPARHVSRAMRPCMSSIANAEAEDHAPRNPELVSDQNPRGSEYVVMILAHAVHHPNDVPPNPQYREVPVTPQTTRVCDYCGKMFDVPRNRNGNKMLYCPGPCAKLAQRRAAGRKVRRKILEATRA